MATSESQRSDAPALGDPVALEHEVGDAGAAQVLAHGHAGLAGADHEHLDTLPTVISLYPRWHAVFDGTAVLEHYVPKSCSDKAAKSAILLFRGFRMNVAGCRSPRKRLHVYHGDSYPLRREETMRKPTLHDVARAAGVSYATADRVFNERGGAGAKSPSCGSGRPSTILDISATSLAANLSRRRVYRFGFHLPVADHGFFRALRHAVEAEADRGGGRSGSRSR